MADEKAPLSRVGRSEKASALTATLVASRPVVDLGTRQVMGYEFMACDHYGFAHSNMALSVQNIEDALQTASVLTLDEIFMAVPADIFADIDLSGKLAWKLRALLSQGTHISVLMSPAQGEAANLSNGQAIQSWRKIGCSVGIDGFGYSAVPALWPWVHHVDLVRIDPRLVSMLRANVIPPLPAQKLVNFVASMNIPRILVDGCMSMDDAKLFQDAGATHGQGAVFGEFHLTNPR
jgi:EAL domain-containing protein (putative c-di-GMP-specific phosphodiesterase class I)